ncbi:Crp/Fnr family transcriptional regulator [Ramlibacter sp.]|uniref:Crp/Fnr family transcriptional regulator n=1 Tax=Ramlibacter sp. TaxID=1917967 RepID=UPI002D4D01A3|nr:Crp/Fnr family transcriptional regulator [Ramlibacter sp.]HYD77024.1 Crp/Fnr family transcriptional regulator [Ramlibacter sp.]
MQAEELGIAVRAGLRRNTLLAGLPAELARWLGRRAEPVLLPAGAVLAVAGQPVRNAWFPVNCVLSLLHADGDGSTLQVGLVGREGVFGFGAVLGGRHLAGATVLVAGPALRVPGDRMRECFEQEPAFREMLLRYCNQLISLGWQAAVCNRHHPPERQIAKLLLLVLDRIPLTELHLTHDHIARLFGLRRETISQAAQRIQEKGYIRYSRGHIRVLDPGGLEQLACSCYARMRPVFAPAEEVAGGPVGQPSVPAPSD